MSPPWMVYVERMLNGNYTEVKGSGFNAKIKAIWDSLPGGSWLWKTFGSDDSKLPWCGAAVAYCMRSAGMEVPDGFASAATWRNYGTKISNPRYGCISILAFKMHNHVQRHVAFVVGIDSKRKKILLAGGNQSDQFNSRWFNMSNVEEYVWPSSNITASNPPEYSSLRGVPGTSVV